MKIGAIICSAIAVIWVLLALLQLWFSLFSLDIFIKLSVSAALLFVIVLVLSLVIREYISDKKMKENGFLDE
ncbi:MAG: hypothetical protein NTV00_17050 [Methylococcales bacterium]|nr:hypothetical protein [Methylococcales bacterium]